MNRAYYAEKGLFVGIVSILCAFFFFASNVFTPKSALIQIKGEVAYVKVYYTRVKSRGSESTKSELKFTLNSSSNVYVLMKNIGQRRYNERFEKLAIELRSSGKAVLWIKESQKDNFKPTVFQIADRNGEILYDFKESKSHSRFGFLISFGLGLFGIGLYLKHRYYKKPSGNNI